MFISLLYFLLGIPSTLLLLILYLIFFRAYLKRAREQNCPELAPSGKMMKIWVVYPVLCIGLAILIILGSNAFGAPEVRKFDPLIPDQYSMYPVLFLLVLYPVGFIILLVVSLVEFIRVRRKWKVLISEEGEPPLQ